jgi:hypothetical protein
MFFTDMVVDQWLRDIVDQCYVALHFDNPDLAGAYASEIFGGAYKRTKVTFTPPESRATFNDSDITFKGLPAITITHIAGWDALINGNLLFFGPLPNPVKIQLGKTFTLSALDLSLSVD